MRPRHFLPALAAALLAAPVLAQPAGVAAPAPRTYHATDLGTLPGGGMSEALALNDRGQVVGFSTSPTGTHATLWWHGTVTDLTPGAGYAVATAVNNSGQVAIYAGAAEVWDRGRLTTVNGITSPFAINEHGDVAGIAGNDAAVWRDGAVEDFGIGAAYGLNDRGQVVGWSLGGSGQQQATLWQDGRRVALAPEPSVATDVNQRGQVCGRAVKDGVWQAFRWQAGHLTWLGETGPVWPVPQQINSRGDVMGLRIGGQYLWRRGTMYDLAELIGPYSGVFDVNGRDQLAGAWYPGGDQTTFHAVVWR